MSAPPHRVAASPLCAVCRSVSTSGYTCPRCESPFCSSQCYREHNGRGCSDDFFVDQVARALKGEKPSEADQRRFRRKLHELGVPAPPPLTAEQILQQLDAGDAPEKNPRTIEELDGRDEDAGRADDPTAAEWGDCYAGDESTATAAISRWLATMKELTTAPISAQSIDAPHSNASQGPGQESREKKHQGQWEGGRWEAEEALWEAAGGDSEDEQPSHGEKEEGEALQQLLERIEQGDALSLDDLPPRLKQRFIADVQNGVVKAEAQEPWWYSNVDLPCKPVDPPQTHLCCSSGKRVNNRCLFFAFRLSFVYAWTHRRLNGDWELLEKGEWETLMRALCPFMLGNSLPEENAQDCLAAALAVRPPPEVFSPADDGEERASNAVCLRDAWALLKDEGSFAVMLGAVGRLSGGMTKQRERLFYQQRCAFLNAFHTFHLRRFTMVNIVPDDEERAAEEELRMLWLEIEPVVATMQTTVERLRGRQMNDGRSTAQETLENVRVFPPSSELP